MSRTTRLTCTTFARMMLRGEIAAKGVVTLEQVGADGGLVERVLSALEKKTPEQGARASELIAQLEKVVANRGEAARHGSTTAADQGADARAQLAALRARSR